MSYDDSSVCSHESVIEDYQRSVRADFGDIRSDFEQSWLGRQRATQGPRYFVCLIRAVRAAFPEIQEEQNRRLCSIMLSGIRAAVALDHVVDRNDLRFLPLAVRCSQLLERGLARLLPEASPCWPEIAATWDRYFLALLRERSLDEGTPPDLDRFLALASEKTAIIQVYAIAVSYLSGFHTRGADLAAIMLKVQGAAQLYDDLCDLVEDVANGQVTLVTQRVRAYCETREQQFPSDPHQLVSVMHQSGISAETLTDIIRVLESAVELAHAAGFGQIAVFLRAVRRDRFRRLQLIRSMIATRE